MCVGRLSMVLILLHMYVYGLSALTDGIPGRPHSQTVDARFRGNYSRAGWTTVDVVDGGVLAFPVAVGATAEFLCLQFFMRQEKQSHDIKNG